MVMEEVMSFVMMVKLILMMMKLILMMMNFGCQVLLMLLNFVGQLLVMMLNCGGQVLLMIIMNFGGQELLMMLNFVGQLLLRVQNLCGQVVKYWLEEVFHQEKRVERMNYDQYLIIIPLFLALFKYAELVKLKEEEEEAKKLKQFLKRKKVESERLSEIEKRQKQRLEEMKETQKKDVENMKLKERIRAEIGKEISKLEMTCHDMASLLRGLGITVGGGTSHEVRVAYKKALLKFHPDRVSPSDIRHQVEAEEKFKLISRMKDKYLPTK